MSNVITVMSAAAKSHIAKVWANADATLATVGGEQCDLIAAAGRKQLPEGYIVTVADAEALAAVAGKERGWKKTTLPVRASHIKQILTARKDLSKAIVATREKQGPCTWNESLALARLLIKGKSVNAAAAAVCAKRSSKSEGPTTAGEAKAKAAGSVKSLLKMKHLPNSFKAALRDACEAAGIELGNA